MLLCAHRELFPLSCRVEGRVEKKHAYRCPLMTPCIPIDVCLCVCVFVCVSACTKIQTNSHRYSWSWTMTCNYSGCLSFPVFVRSYLVLLWKPNVILKNPAPPLSPSLSPSLSLSFALFGFPHFPVEKGQSIRKSQASSPTLAAANRLSAMIHGKDRVYTNTMLVDQVSQACFLYKLSVNNNRLCSYYIKPFFKWSTSQTVESFPLVAF